MNNQSELKEQTVTAGLEAISKLGQDLIRENRRARRWKIIGRLFFGLILLSIFVLPYFMQDRLGKLVTVNGPHAAVISMEGLVMAGAEIDADIIEESLSLAFSAKQSKGVILQINSPGGSPVQAELIYNEIMRQKSLYPNKKVVAVIEDIGASAAYYIASASDEIVASNASLIGSIGVIINGFGAVDALKKLGIERRLITAGDNKGMLDPFLPQDSTQQAYMQKIVDQVHDQFIMAVKQGRGDRLADNADIFSGLVFNGSESKALGLIDYIGSMGFAMREILQVDKQVDYTAKRDWFETFAKQLGTSLAENFNKLMLKQGAGLQ